MRVLFVDCVGIFGGASRSLFELVAKLRSDNNIDSFFITPKGSVENYYSKVSNEYFTASRMVRFNNSFNGYYRGLRWLIVIREILGIFPTIYVSYKAYKKIKKVDLIHINEIHDLPSGLIIKAFFKAPLIVHLRCRQKEKSNFISKIVDYLVKKYVDKIIAIDGNTACSMPNCSSKIAIVNNSFTHEIQNKRIKSDRTHLNFGFVGNVMRNKGILELVQAFKMLLESGSSSNLIIAGGRIRKLSGFRRKILQLVNLEEDAFPEVESFINENNLNNRIKLLGHIDNIDEVYSKMDVLVFPSYFDSPGRPIFEAAFHGIPSIACISRPMDDTFIEGQTGIACKMKDPIDLYKKLNYFDTNTDKVFEMGQKANDLANRNFLPNKNAKKVYALYNDVLKFY